MTDVCVHFDEGSNVANRCDDFPSEFNKIFSRSPFQWNDSKNAGFSTGNSTWLPISENYRTRNVDRQEGQKESHLENFKTLMRLKKTEAGITGMLKLFAINENILMIKRELDDSSKESIIAFLNFGQFYSHTRMYDLRDHDIGYVNIKVSKINSIHRVGATVNFNDIRFVPYDVIVATYYNASDIMKVNFILVLIALFVTLLK